MLRVRKANREGIVVADTYQVNPKMAGTTFAQIKLLSDGSVPAAQTDPNLINPWGVSFSPTSPPFSQAAKPLLRAFPSSSRFQPQSCSP
jgi:hypothetical protein